MEKQEDGHPQGGKAKFQEDFDDNYINPDQQDHQEAAGENDRDYGGEDFNVKRAKPKQKKEEAKQQMHPDHEEQK